MTPRGRGGGCLPPNCGCHLPPNRGGYGVHIGERASLNTNSPISSIYPTTI